LVELLDSTLTKLAEDNGLRVVILREGQAAFLEKRQPALRGNSVKRDLTQTRPPRLARMAGVGRQGF